MRECIALNSHLIFLIHFRRQNSSREQPIAVKLAHSGTNKSSKKKNRNNNTYSANTLDEEDTLARLGILQLSQIIQLINLFISSE